MDVVTQGLSGKEYRFTVHPITDIPSAACCVFIYAKRCFPDKVALLFIDYAEESIHRRIAFHDRDDINRLASRYGCTHVLVHDATRPGGPQTGREAASAAKDLMLGYRTPLNRPEDLSWEDADAPALPQAVHAEASRGACALSPAGLAGWDRLQPAESRTPVVALQAGMAAPRKGRRRGRAGRDGGGRLRPARHWADMLLAQARLARAWPVWIGAGTRCFPGGGHPRPRMAGEACPAASSARRRATRQASRLGMTPRRLRTPPAAGFAFAPEAGPAVRTALRRHPALPCRNGRAFLRPLPLQAGVLRFRTFLHFFQAALAGRKGTPGRRAAGIPAPRRQRQARTPKG